MRGQKQITVAGANLFRLAAEHLGDARQWTRIAAANGLSDPFVEGVATLTIPPPDRQVVSDGILRPL